MRIVSVQEYRYVPIATRASSDPPTVTRSEVVALERLQRARGTTWFELGHRSIRATNWVGTVAMGRRLLEVLPKIDLPGSELVQQNLHLMLAASGLLPVDEADVAPLTRSGQPLLPIYLAVYVRRLAREWQRGALRRYALREESSTFLRGKLLVGRQIRENAMHPERFLCTRDEFSEDNAASRILKGALKICREQEFATAVARSAAALLAEFDQVGDCVPSDLADATPLERQHQRYRPLLDMARLILSEESPGARAGGERAFALMFDMNVVFESFVAAELARALAMRFPTLRVVPQASDRWLLKRLDGAKTRGAFRLRPDIAVWSGRAALCVLDTKWKRLDPSKRHHGVREADVYQAYAYANEYVVPRTILLYPRTSETSERIAEYELDRMPKAAEDRPPALCIRTLNVARRLCDRTEREQLRSELRTLIDGTS